MPVSNIRCRHLTLYAVRHLILYASAGGKASNIGCWHIIPDAFTCRRLFRWHPILDAFPTRYLDLPLRYIPKPGARVPSPAEVLAIFLNSRSQYAIRIGTRDSNGASRVGGGNSFSPR